MGGLSARPPDFNTHVHMHACKIRKSPVTFCSQQNTYSNCH